MRTTNEATGQANRDAVFAQLHTMMLRAPGLLFLDGEGTRPSDNGRTASGPRAPRIAGIRLRPPAAGLYRTGCDPSGPLSCLESRFLPSLPAKPPEQCPGAFLLQ